MKCQPSLLVVLGLVVAGLAIVLLTGCDEMESPIADTGIKKVTADVMTGADGMTNEQRNVRRRLEEDNKPGAIKYIYLVSNMTGDCLFYDIVDGKVTSSGKRLTSGEYLAPGDGGQYNRHFVMDRIGDDGTYGSSTPYLYYWNTNGIYRQVYITGGTTLIVSEEPIRFPKIVVNLAGVSELDK